MEIQTHFETTFSPTHFGNQDYLHVDRYVHIVTPNNYLIRPYIDFTPHIPVSGPLNFNNSPMSLGGMPKNPF